MFVVKLLPIAVETVERDKGPLRERMKDRCAERTRTKDKSKFKCQVQTQ